MRVKSRTSGGASPSIVRLVWLAPIAAACLIGGAVTPAYAVQADRYRVDLAAWIPQDRIDGPEPSKSCLGYVNLLASYAGNGHVGFDGGTKATVSYEFTYDAGRWADVAVNVNYGRTEATDGVCQYSGQATKAGGVSPQGTGVRLWMSSANPLVTGAPTIDDTLDVSLNSADEMVLVHHPDRFPSHGFRVWKNGRVIGTAVDYDVSCVKTNGFLGVKNVGWGLTRKVKPITHHLDLRVADQNYFGACGKPAPEKFHFPG